LIDRRRWWLHAGRPTRRADRCSSSAEVGRLRGSTSPVIVVLSAGTRHRSATV